MKSKSVDTDHASVYNPNQNRTFDFVNLYKSSSETSDSVNRTNKPSDNNDTGPDQVKSTKRDKWNNKRKKDKRESIDISLINIEASVLNSTAGGSTPLDDSKVTSTPLGARYHQGKTSKVKSIMKGAAVTDTTMDGSHIDISPNKSKKRNKSVSFMLEDNEEVVIKKTKSNEPTTDTKTDSTSKAKKQFYKTKKKKHSEKENKLNGNLDEKDKSTKETKKSKTKLIRSDIFETSPIESVGETVSEIETKKKKKKVKNFKNVELNDTATESTSQDLSENIKKPKKKKHQEKQVSDPDIEEPVAKTRKTNDNPDVVAELENLSIGDNAHTLTNLLDEMTVVDKDKRKKLKQKFNKNKKPKGDDTPEESKKTEIIKEKVKWQRRKWNKDAKGEVTESSVGKTLIVENLPLSFLFSYKKVLAEHFVKYGLIRSVGIAEAYPTEVSKPVFTTTINFYSDEAATQALEEDSRLLEGSRIQLKRLLPPTDTTVVVRSYGPLTNQFISSSFRSAGLIRNIRCSVKGKHTMGTFFVEFDGPESVERALKMATNIKIREKKVYVSKFEIRAKKVKQEKTQDNEASDADQSEDSQG